ncbi:hypothetical protein KUF71_021837 [Frankliniella fusca]|uniref:Uncharacterized protein n=1 Tax=Frankliniella fusca TaxID=407009 RepID=A0AAE1GZZ7_9NEOP|nr:hypothetical protein KUF71_021837 [Frankliniella fusca]
MGLGRDTYAPSSTKLRSLSTDASNSGAQFHVMTCTSTFCGQDRRLRNVTINHTAWKERKKSNKVAFQTDDWAPPDRMTGQWEVEARQDDRGGEEQKEKFLRKRAQASTWRPRLRPPPRPGLYLEAAGLQANVAVVGLARRQQKHRVGPLGPELERDLRRVLGILERVLDVAGAVERGCNREPMLIAIKRILHETGNADSFVTGLNWPVLGSPASTRPYLGIHNINNSPAARRIGITFTPVTDMVSRSVVRKDHYELAFLLLAELNLNLTLTLNAQPCQKAQGATAWKMGWREVKRQIWERKVKGEVRQMSNAWLFPALRNVSKKEKCAGVRADDDDDDDDDDYDDMANESACHGPGAAPEQSTARSPALAKTVMKA